MISLGGALAAVVVVTLLASLAAVRLLDRSSRRWRDVLRARFVVGVPWGSLIVMAFVLAVYLFVQDGISDFGDPVTLPFRAWSYFYPLGMLTSSFSHASSGHLIGNLVGAAVVAPIAEYAWGHYPRGREERSSSGPAWLTNPRLRAFVVFPLAVIGVGLLLSVFAVGPVIGFSGVVFAFVGFAIVRYPITTLVAIVGIRGVVATIYNAVRSPIYVYQASPRPPSAPSWATTAIQGHALGFFVGFLLAVAVFYRRGYRPDPFRLWVAILAFAFSRSLWAIYWFRGGGEYVLYRGPGVVVVTGLALVVTLAVTASERPLLPPAVRDRLPGRADEVSGNRSRRLERVLEIGLPAAGSRNPGDGSRIRDLAAGTSARTSRLSDLGRRQASLVAVLLVVALLAGPAIPANLFVVDGASNPSDASVTVEDYTVTYAEGVENEMISVVEISALGEATAVESSGVIVSSSERNIWMEVVSDQRLAFEGTSSVDVGGPGWRETVYAERAGWSAVGNDTAYQVWLWADGDDREVAFASDPVRADVLIDGRTVTIVPDDGAFELAVEAEDGSVETVEVPDEDETVEANGLVFERVGDAVYAASDGTYVQVASEERYEL